MRLIDISPIIRESDICEDKKCSQCSLFPVNSCYSMVDFLMSLPSVQPSPIWHECFDDDPESFPDDDRTVLVSFDNFSQPMLGQWRHDPDIGGAWYIGDTDETFIENDLFVDGWWELPKKPEVMG